VIVFGFTPDGRYIMVVYERPGIDRATLSRLVENNEDANPTLMTLERYAEAVGKQVVVLLSESTS
jgi:hypothetical protein